MPQSLSKVIIHIIFSTKDREPWLGLTYGRECMLILPQSAVISVPKWCALAVLLIMFTLSRRCRELFPKLNSSKQIKKVSSKWIKTLDARYRGFFWQRGYGAFSVSPSQLEAVLEYVDTQQEHHRTRSFQEEYRELLRRHGVDFDERYVWD